ncbi:hypothetical protein N0V86_005752 [Didymella sp. IMI 355093]|nr:hypothetical protein N0V86_005752 [Didymella sp. IMI 355093]
MDHARSTSPLSISSVDSRTFGDATEEGDIAMQPVRSIPRSSDAYNIIHTPTTINSQFIQSPPLPGPEDSLQRLLAADNSGTNHQQGKEFDSAAARKKLFRVGILRFAATVVFSGVLCVCLKAYAGWHIAYPLSRKDVKLFNALTIAISICLGLNLLGSLKRYAVILRWSILTRSYMSVEDFDLVLGIGELSNVARLMLGSLPWFPALHWLNKKRPGQLPKARRSGTHLTAVLCSIWLLINIGSQILVALLSLFWPVDSYECPLLAYGTVSVADLSLWNREPDGSGLPLPVPRESNDTYMEAAWMYGAEAANWKTFSSDENITDLTKLPGTPIYHDKAHDIWEYRFFYRNPDLPYGEYLLSNRSVQVNASCEQMEVQGTIDWNKTESDYYTIVSRTSGEEEWSPYLVYEFTSYGTSWSASQYEACGPRCTSLMVLHVPGDITRNATRPSLWFCNNTVSDIIRHKPEQELTIDDNDKRVYGTDEFARIAAGAIAWTGNNRPTSAGIEDNTFMLEGVQSRTYFQNSTWGPPADATTKDIERMLMHCTTGAIAAFDDHGVRHKIKINDLVCPKNSQQLNVDWPYILSILGGICAIQLAALICLIVFANRAIIRDESFFSTAVLLRPVVDAIKDEPGATAMKGRDIKDHPKLRYRRLRYGYKESADGEPHEIAVFFQGRDSSEIPTKWASGRYR